MKYSDCTFHNRFKRRASIGLVVAACTMFNASNAFAVPVPGGTLDPTLVPKYVTPLVIPPVMNNTGVANDYDIAVRQFSQQILPGGIWNTINGRADVYPPTRVWSYGPVNDPLPDSTALGGGVGVAPAANSQFNYPAYTVETLVGQTNTVTWINDLVVDPYACAKADRKTRLTTPACNYLSHLLPVDRSLHWANPEQLPCSDGAKTKDCRPALANGAVLGEAYRGPVPMIPHVHGAHVGPESDGYPEAWWLPNANNIPASYASTGTLVNQYGVVTNDARKPGQANFSYPNTQPSTTLWFHDHALGMTRSNVYAGPAGFWLIRDGAAKTGETGLVSGTLPGPAPKLGDSLKYTSYPAAQGGKRETYREIPLLIQDRSFNVDGSLFYPANRAFFEGLGDGFAPGVNTAHGLNIDTIGTVSNGAVANSDISPIWNPEAFFNVMVVNGAAWPTLDVAQAQYRFRVLNACNSRFLNLALYVVAANGKLTNREVPIYQIGAEQGMLPKVVKITTGYRTVLPGNGSVPRATRAAAPETALLMGLAERADILIDFSGLANGTRVRMINTAPDAPFGGFPDVAADPDTTGQVMEFVVNNAYNGQSSSDPAGKKPATKPENLVLSLPDAQDPAASGLVQANVREMALLEEESSIICAVVAPDGTIEQDRASLPDNANPGTCVDKTTGQLAASLPFAPKAAVLGINGSAGGSPTLWADPLKTNPALGSTETWELWNSTDDAHPIHVHLVKFKVVEREAFDPATNALSGVKNAPEATEAGWKDTVIAYPGEVTRISATFDVAGLYVWHCHILEHEDNEMMVPFCIGDQATAPGCGAVP